MYIFVNGWKAQYCNSLCEYIDFVDMIPNGVQMYLVEFECIIVCDWMEGMVLPKSM